MNRVMGVRWMEWWSASEREHVDMTPKDESMEDFEVAVLEAGGIARI